MAELLFLLITGGMVEETIASLRHACKDEQEAKNIIRLLSQHVAQHAQQQQPQPIPNGRAVIDPTEVFNRGEKNEYKG